MARILCIDIEGGYGGSSRSLAESLRFMDRDGLDIEVWCAKAGPIQATYAELGIPYRTMPSMPRFSALAKLSRNLAGRLRYAADWARAGDWRRALATCGADLVHLNHESLSGTAAWLRRKARPVTTMHVRTQLPPGAFARFQTRQIATNADGLVFITENELATFRRHLGGPLKAAHAVIHNIAGPAAMPRPDPILPRDGSLTIACLSNFAWARGTDRVVDLAAELKRIGRRDVRFLMAGNMRLPRSLPGELGAIARRGGDLADYARHRGVAEMMVFLGHTDRPERVLASADALIKPTREANPWGRDILEALAAGLPVLSVGTYSMFVEDGVTGILQPGFDPGDLAARIGALADDRETVARMGRAGAARVASLCGGQARAADLRAFWLARLGSAHG
jgi:glycosyltransferase involved in cell wall biosynthesis